MAAWAAALGLVLAAAAMVAFSYPVFNRRIDDPHHIIEGLQAQGPRAQGPS